MNVLRDTKTNLIGSLRFGNMKIMRISGRVNY